MSKTFRIGPVHVAFHAYRELMYPYWGIAAHLGLQSAGFNLEMGKYDLTVSVYGVAK